MEHKHAYVLLGEDGEFTGEVRGRLLKRDHARSSLPAVGDWVAVEKRGDGTRVLIQAVLPRRTQFSRRAAGDREEEQVVAANIDVVFLLSGLDADFNPRRIERYLALARGSGAQPVVVLNKSDLCPDTAARFADTRSLAGGTPVIAISAETGAGVDALAPFLQPGRTIALLGSSGVGKSTLVNRLLGSSRQAVAAVRVHDQRGKHTTTRRELIALPGGALLVDTPGMRELQLWDAARDGLLAVFPEIMELARSCRFRDCRHDSEPGCRVTAALAAGELAPERYGSFAKLRAELEAHNAGPGNGPAGRAHGPKVKGRRIMRG
jgi:ribosome biogenesis GTPase